jgi:hypothetical protein
MELLFDERFVEAFVSRPGGHRVMGRRLMPFCAWHRLQLEYVQSPLVLGGEVSWGQLDLASAICATQFPVAVEYKPPHRWMAFWRAWRWPVVRELRAFEAYLADYASGPQIMENEGDDKSVPDIDPIMTEVVAYRKMSGCAREEAWNVPLGEMAWMNAAYARMQGAKFAIVTPVDEAIVAELRKRRKLTEEK